MRLILVRHGQTTSNVGGLLDTDEPGADLTDLGREQAAALPGALGHEPIELIVASTLVRTQQTAGPLALAKRLDTLVRPGVREVRAGDLEMLGDMASVRTYLETIFEWSAGNLHLRVPGGESGEEFFARYDEVVAEVAATGVSTAVVVSHGAAIRSWVAARTDNVSIEHAATHPVTNTGAVVVEGSPAEGWTTLAWEGHALGGPAVEERQSDGAAADTVDVQG